MNKYIRVKNKSEIVTKTLMKGFKVKNLYCILDDKAFIYQGFKIIELSIEMLANGLDIDLINAQRILAGEDIDLEEKDMLKEAFEEQMNEIKKEASDMIPDTDSVTDLTQTGISDNFESIIDNLKPNTKIDDPSLVDVIKDLQNRVEYLENILIANEIGLPEESEVDGEESENIEEEIE